MIDDQSAFLWEATWFVNLHSANSKAHNNDLGFSNLSVDFKK